MRNGNNRVIRGGSWNNNANNCRVANRNNNNPDNDNNNLGFRVCLIAQPLDPAWMRSGTKQVVDPVDVLPNGRYVVGKKR